MATQNKAILQMEKEELTKPEWCEFCDNEVGKVKKDLQQQTRVPKTTIDRLEAILEENPIGDDNRATILEILNETKLYTREQIKEQLQEQFPMLKDDGYCYPICNSKLFYDGGRLYKETWCKYNHFVSKTQIDQYNKKESYPVFCKQHGCFRKVRKGKEEHCSKHRGANK